MNRAKAMVAALAMVGTVAGADFWTSKPFTQWSDKDVRKMASGSPWAREIMVTPGGGADPDHGADRRGSTFQDNPTTMRPNDNVQNAAGGAPVSNGGSSGDEERQKTAASYKMVIQWRSALPVRQALARARFGKEAATSAEAKQFLEVPPTDYVIALVGVPRLLLNGKGDALTKSLMDRTTLIAGGKPPLHPAEIEFRGDRNVDVFFAFPKSDPIIAEDLTAEFAIKLEPLVIKEKFRLKDMFFQGKLEL